MIRHREENTNLKIERSSNRVQFVLRIRGLGDKLIKSVWRMPRLLEAMKDAISCENPRGSAHTK